MNTRDDRIYLTTRVAAGVVILVLLLAFVALYLFPENTNTDFAWTITPITTAMLMGAGYIAGAYFFLRVLTEKKWHHVQAGFLPITAFTIFMLAATLLHLDRFRQGSFQFYLWTVIYIVTPFLVPLLWWNNHRTDPGTPEERDYRLPLAFRWALGIAGLVAAAVMVLFFGRPAILISIAPWKLSELTARVGSGWGMLTALTAVSIAHDGRWSAARILVESGAIGPALMLLALFRIAGDFDWGNRGAWVFVAGLAAAFIFLAGARVKLG
jgi:hypothetical protein